MKSLRATYRLQFREGMTFARAAALAPYWRDLGISHLYASPVFAATAGSTHGYDVTDFNRLEPTLGGEADFLRMSDALREAGLGLILDFVPNHMAASPENPWWADVLARGEASRYARHFDIDWEAGPLLLPVLGGSFAEVLEKGELALERAGDGVHLRYYEQSFPLSAESTAALPADLGGAARDKELIARLHEAQAYRLTHWVTGREQLTYRRFFEITGLVGVRVEEPAVFDDVHRLLLRLASEGRVQGVRVDHVDGLADPTGYLADLREAVGPDVAIHVEKILEGEERLPAAWPIEGSTGYEFAAAMSRLLTRDAGEALSRAYDDFTGERHDYAAMAMRARREILTHNLAAELNLLTALAEELAGEVGHPAEAASLRRALIAFICAFPVYRSYVGPEGAGEADRALIREVAESARHALPREDLAALGLLVELLQLDPPWRRNPVARRFSARLQQTTGPVMAKAVEDTLFYRFNRLIGVNEVGGDPLRLGEAAGSLQDWFAERQETQPLGLSATATHDTKRGEDARMRLTVLTAAPGLWLEVVRRWSGMADSAPDRETEWLVFQALLGSWPLGLEAEDEAGLAAFAERFQAYLEKALREAKERTTWTDVNEAYEGATRAFLASLLGPGGLAFRRDFIETCKPFWRAGALKSLAQLLLKLTLPGVPDIYQGTEGWDLSLVDPDNRRPPDFESLAARLEAVQAAKPAALLEHWADAGVKLHVLVAGLAARRDRPALFAEGEHLPLDTAGPKAEELFAFARNRAGEAAVVVVPRAAYGLLNGGESLLPPPKTWQDSAVLLPNSLAGRRWRCRLTGRRFEAADRLPLSKLFESFPLALLES